MRAEYLNQLDYNKLPIKPQTDFICKIPMNRSTHMVAKNIPNQPLIDHERTSVHVILFLALDGNGVQSMPVWVKVAGEGCHVS